METDLFNRDLGWLKFRQESGAETGPEDLNAVFRDHSEEAERFTASEVWCAAAGERRTDLPLWVHRATDEKGRLRDRVIPCWVTASDHTIGQVRVKFWRDDKAASFDTLIERMREHFTVLDDAPTMPTVQDDQALAGAVEVSQAPQADPAPPASVEVPQVAQNAGDNPLGLTGRLKEIADLVAQGLQRKEIAGQLVIGVGTVNDYAHEIAQMVEEHTGQPVKAHTLGTRLTSLGYGPATLP